MEPVSILLGAAGGAASAAASAALLGRNREHRTELKGLADLLNWAFLVDDGVVLEKDGALVAGFRYRGPDFGNATPAELGALSRHLNDAFLPYTDGWMFHVDAIRSPAAPYTRDAFPDLVTGWVDAERRRAFRSSRPQFVSDYTFTVTYLPPRELFARAGSMFVQRAGGAYGISASGGIDWNQILGSFREALDTLERRLGARLHVERLDSDALITHLHRCLTGLRHPVRAPIHGAYLNTVLASQEMVGGFTPMVGSLHMKVVALTGYPSASAPGALDFLNALPVSYRWSSRFIPVSTQTATRLIKRHQQHWFMGRKGLGTFLRDVTGASDPVTAARREAQNEALFHDQDATSMARDAAAAAAENASGEVRFGFTTQTVVLTDSDLAQLSRNAAMITGALQDRGFPARIETVNALDAFFGTLPGHGYENLRRPLISTRNVADLWPVTSVWPGLAHNPSQYFPSDASPLMHVATDGSTPFRLNLHVGDVGHTLVVGATGGGKSTLVGLTVAQWQRYAPSLGAQTFIFDVGYSHWLLARAAGAEHYDIGAGRVDSLSFQPLADVDRPSERAWAAGWIETLLDLQGVRVTPQHRTRLARALSLLAREPREFRTLTELTVHLQDPLLADALKPYTVGGSYGQLLDASEDALPSALRDATGAERRRARYQVFELRALMDMDDKVLVPTLLYLFRRVERQLDGRPTLLVIEELWAPLMRTVFANRIKQWLLTLRKQNAAVMLVAHTPSQLDTVPAKQVLIESCPTKIMLPNPEATSPANVRAYRDLGLNDRELEIIAGAIPKRDYYVKSPLGSRLVRLDLGPVALAFIGTPDGMTPDRLRPTVEALVEEARAEQGTGDVGVDLSGCRCEPWQSRWLRHLGTDVSATEAAAAELSEADVQRAPPAWVRATDQAEEPDESSEHLHDENDSDEERYSYAEAF